MRTKFITYICTHTHAVADCPWFTGAGFYVGGQNPQEWDGPFVSQEAARQEHGNIRCHSPARGSRSRS
jgi:hypothetical protein